MLPEKCLNGRGFRIGTSDGTWMDLPQDIPSSITVSCEMSFNKFRTADLRGF
jgi:hypothetical protein